jgi:purine-binding chemotaxis protein CheW
MVAKNIEQGINDIMIDDSEQCLTFILDGEEYGVDILRVQEIKGWGNATPMPNTPDYIKGVINLRGSIVPIIDLRILFNMESIAYGATTVVIVLKTVTANVERTMGIVVDAVSDVYNIGTEDLSPPPDLGELTIKYVKGLAMFSDKMVIVLDIDGLLNEGLIQTIVEPDQ